MTVMTTINSTIVKPLLARALRFLFIYWFRSEQSGPFVKNLLLALLWRARLNSLLNFNRSQSYFQALRALEEAIGPACSAFRRLNKVPVTGSCARRGNLNASEEIVWREKKFSTFAPKKFRASQRAIDSLQVLGKARSLEFRD